MSSGMPNYVSFVVIIAVMFLAALCYCVTIDTCFFPVPDPSRSNVVAIDRMRI